ncbi:MAG TPA: fibronectin type III domain-containing protein [Methanomassiliicoccales archaeon]|jgi:cytochrome c biogenesis protein CcdA/thiol-disulfide isomerase/thioredoxin
MRSRSLTIMALALMLSLASVSGLAYGGDGALSVAQTNDIVMKAPLATSYIGDSVDGSIVIYYFWAIGCSHCAATEPFIDSLAAKYTQVTFLKLEITHNRTNYLQFLDFNNAFSTGRTTTPSVFIENEVALIGPDEIRADLESTILRLTQVDPPSAPQFLVANAGNGGVSLTWSTPADNGGAVITGYDVYRGYVSGGQESTPIAALGNVLAYTDTGLTNGVTYYYRVSAVNSDGAGERSNEAAATPATTPSAPSLTSATPGNGQVVLIWASPSGNGGSIITNYRVYRGIASGYETLLTTVGDVLTYTDSGLDNDQTYCYRVSAVNGAGDGPVSDQLSATPVGPPTTPQNFQVSPGDGCINLSWQAPASNGGSVITNYELWRGISPGEESFLTDVYPNLWFNDTGLTNGQTYYYIIRAENAQGSAPSSNEVYAIPGKAPTAPTAPRSLTATAGNGQIILTWSVPANNGGSTVTNYNVYRSMTSGSETLFLTLGSALTYTDRGLTNCQTYYYEVSAVNSVGEGPRSVESSATPATVPTAPQNLQASRGDGYINLSWQAPFYDGCSVITNYELWRGVSSDAETILTDAYPNLWFNDTDQINGQTYHYKVRAVNAQGPGPESNEVNITSIGTAVAPSVPQDFVVTSGDGQVLLSWNAPPSNGSAAISGYLIFRGTSPASMTLLNTVTSTSYTDTGLTNGQVYYYRVCAFSSAGNGTMTDVLDSTPKGGFSTDLTIGMVIAAAAIDSINPCAISVMIFLLMFLTSLGNKRRVLLVGIAYIVTVFLVYLIAGIGLLAFLQSTAMTRYVYYGAAVLSIAIGVINIKDYIFPGNKPTVAIPESRKPLIKKYIEKASIPAAVVLGAMVSMFELPCTGGIYLAILSLLGDNMTAAQGMPYLVLYNLIFVLPLAAILVIIYFGVSAQKANEWRLEKRSKLRLVIGAVMLLLGTVMLFGVI